MGYYTDYSLNVEEGSLEQAERVFASIQNQYRLEVYGYNAEVFETKWYYHEEHCKNATRLEPDVLLRVEGVGEEHPDHWVKWFRNGKIEGAWRLKADTPRTLDDLKRLNRESK